MFDYNLYGDPAMKREGISVGGPSEPEIDGPNTGKPGVDYDYNFKSIHPLDEEIYYYIIWGDDHVQDWTGPYHSGEIVTFNHTFTKEGTYTISAKAKDIYDTESGWSDFEVIIPKNKAVYNTFLQWFLNQFPLLDRLLTLITTFQGLLTLSPHVKTKGQGGI
jgi:hypothetical protein